MKKADNFNPGKWLVENKITFQSRLNEGNVNLGALNILPGVEKFAPYYLQKINKELTGTTPREFLKWSMRGHTIRDGEDTLKIAKQSGTWDDYSDEDLAKIDLGLNFNTDYWDKDTEIDQSDIDEYFEFLSNNLPMSMRSGKISSDEPKKSGELINKARKAKLLTDIYYIEELRDLRQYGLEDELGYHAGGAVAASELDPDVLKDPNFRKVAFLYIRKGALGMYKDGTFEDKKDNTADVEETDIEFLD